MRGFLERDTAAMATTSWDQFRLDASGTHFQTSQSWSDLRRGLVAKDDRDTACLAPQLRKIRKANASTGNLKSMRNTRSNDIVNGNRHSANASGSSLTKNTSWTSSPSLPTAKNATNSSRKQPQLSGSGSSTALQMLGMKRVSPTTRKERVSDILRHKRDGARLGRISRSGHFVPANSPA